MTAELKLIEDIMDLDEGTLTTDSILDDYDDWDSMTKLSLIALAKNKFSKDLNIEIVRGFITAGDICNFLNS